MIVADTGAIVALIDADDKHHAAMVALFTRDPSAWVLPWAILPEVDYLLQRYLGAPLATSFMADIAGGAFSVEWGNEADIPRALEIREQYRALQLGLVDSIVAAIAERLRAAAIATIDLRDFSALELKGRPKLYPRDAPKRGTRIAESVPPYVAADGASWIGSMKGTSTLKGDLVAPATEPEE